MIYDRTTCPRCQREVSICQGKYANHSISPRTRELCRLSKMRVPPTGTSPEDYETRAAIVADLAWQVQDGDPLLTWEYLSGMDSTDRQRLMMVALAGIPLDRGKVDDIFAWVYQLPAAQFQEIA